MGFTLPTSAGGWFLIESDAGSPIDLQTEKRGAVSPLNPDEAEAIAYALLAAAAIARAK